MSNLKTVICVDDEDQILRALKRCLRGESYELLTTTNPEEALGWVKQGKAQVVISDYRMQKTNGLDLLKKVQAIDSKIVRVILSGYAEQEAINQAMVEGVVFNYLLKPWEAEDLRAKIQRYFERYASEGRSKE